MKRSKARMHYLIVTEWDEFRQVDWSKVSSLMESPLIVDGRNMFDPQEIGAKGFRYISIGRESVAPPRSAANAAAVPPLRCGTKNSRRIPQFRFRQEFKNRWQVDTISGRSK